MATWMVGHWGQPALREEWGPQLASGEKLASYCLTEPGAGSDAASLSTRAQRQGATTSSTAPRPSSRAAAIPIC